MKTLLLFLVTALLVACAAPQRSTYSPIIDRPGPNYATDLRECQAHAMQLASAADRAVAGAVAGAVFGALFSAAVGGGRYRNNYVAAGALGGATGEAARADHDEKTVISNCMRARGYAVLQ